MIHVFLTAQKMVVFQLVRGEPRVGWKRSQALEYRLPEYRDPEYRLPEYRAAEYRLPEYRAAEYRAAERAESEHRGVYMSMDRLQW